MRADPFGPPRTRRVGPRQLVALVLVLGVVALVVSVALHRGSASVPVGGSRATSTLPPVVPTPTEPAGASTAAAEPTVTPSAAASSSPGRDLSGRKLADAWLKGYLNRSSRDDDGWVAEIRDITDPTLLTQLQANGPDAVGLFQLQRWRVSAVKPYDDPDQPLDTPSRQVLAYQATVTDGEKSERKPFLLYCYRSPDQRWTVSMVEQPYTSES